MPEASFLISLLRDEIQSHGPISFARFMEQALYHPEYGYYARGVVIGRKGDFYTSVSVGPIFGEMLARQFNEVWLQLERPPSFTIFEQAAHQGQLAVDILQSLRDQHPDCFQSVRYHILEPLDRLNEWQHQTLASANLLEKTQWSSSAATAASAPAGLYFSNELIDSFPVHRVIFQNGAWQELRVAWKENGFSWQAVPPSPELVPWLTRLPNSRPDGYTTEICVALGSWAQTVAPLLTKGVWWVIDYGFDHELYYHPDRLEGTLQGYFEHRKANDPFLNVGHQDLTAHVDFTAVTQAARTAGLSPLGLTDQHHFLVGLLELNPELAPDRVRGLKTLLHPEMMGTRFQYLALSKNCNLAGKLSGLKYAYSLCP
jgi:SAM-dependent MidA family methyltransferase